MSKLSAEERARYLSDLQKANEKYTASSGQRPAKIPEGAHRIRILPHWRTKSPATPDAYRRYAQHWVKGPARQSQDGGKMSNIIATTLCQRNTDQKPCPVCDAYWNVKKAPGLAKDVEKLLDECKGTTKYLVNALHRNSAEPNKVLVMELPFKVGTAIFGDPKAGTTGLFGQAVNMIGAYPMDLEDGVDVVVRRTGNGFNTVYAVEFPTPMDSTPVPAGILDELIDLDAYIEAFRHTPEDEIKAVNAIMSLGQASVPNQAILMGGNFAPAPATQYVPPAPAYVAPQAPVAAPVAPPQGVVVPPVGGPVNLAEDVFTGANQASNDGMSDSDVENLLAGLEN